jgi:hypothetical protein
MADEPETPIDDEELLLTDEVEDEAPEAEEEGEAEEVPSFGDDAEPQAADTGLVKHLRQQIKERDRRLAEVSAAVPKAEPIVVGEKPKLADFDYDEEAFDKARDAWQERKEASERQQQTQTQAGEQEQQAWQAELHRYNESKSKLGFADISDAEENVKASLDTAQQAVLLMAADDPAKLMYALGKHPDRLAALAAETNPLKLAAKIARMEGQLKMVQRRKPPEPDTPERGSGKLSRVSADKTLAKLEAAAEKSGDRTELVAYKRKLREAKTK